MPPDISSHPDMYGQALTKMSVAGLRHVSLCQKSKVTGHTFAPHASFVPPDARFEVVHILDLVRPLPVSQGYKYLLTRVDRFTCWPEDFPLIDITAESVAHTFVLGWIARFGVPVVIVTD